MTGIGKVSSGLEEPIFVEPVKKSKKKPNYGGIDIRSESYSDSDSGSTDSSSSSSVAPPLEGRRYGENVFDRWARHRVAKKDKKEGNRGRKAKNRRRERRSRSTLTASALSFSGSEVEALERLEENKTASTALRKLWKNVKYLREKIQKLEDAISETDSNDSKRQSKATRKKVKPKVESSRGKHLGSETQEEEEAKSGELKANISVQKFPDPLSSEDDAAIDNQIGHAKEGPDEHEVAIPERQSHNAQNADTSDVKEEPSMVEDEERATDGDDEGSGDENENEIESTDAENVEETSAPAGFELKCQFFEHRDDYELNQFHDDEINPFIRVRWTSINHGASADNTEMVDGKKGRPAAGGIDILQITLESLAFKTFINSIYNPPQQHPVSGLPGPPLPRSKHRSWHRLQKRPDYSVTFYKPFRWLIQNKELLEDEMRKYKHEVTSENEIHSESDQSLESDMGQQLRLLLDFMDEYLAEPLKRYEDARAGNLKTIGFEDLWMLYKPGDIIYCPLRTALATANPPAPSNVPHAYDASGMRPMGPGPNTYRQGFGRDAPQAYKIISVAGGRRYAAPPPPVERMANSYTPLKLVCYFLDIGGYRFDVVTDTFTFRPFDTEMAITDLDAYPLAYASFGENCGDGGMRKFLAARGKSFVEVCEASHKLYNGSAWTDSQMNKEEIDTPVIIDFALAYQNIPAWRPPFCVPHIDFYNTPGRPIRAETFEVVTASRINKSVDWYWSHQTELVNQARNTISETMQNYPVVGTVASDPAIPELIAMMEANGDILLLPGVVYAFALRDRKWVALDLTLLQDTQYEDGWKDLILPAGHKEMVRAVVENHAAGSRATGGMKQNSAEVDIVRGKGKGCIILLHGEPGVGKTSTAECVAAFTKRPLFPITCGDIGYEPDEVERNLQKHFTLAHKWGCVMLLDEADVFLAKRSRDDIKRNGLVSVFLRILEYYPGILFLTTNRVGSFDDAFRSRLHLTLYYPKLDRKQTLQIFEMNIRRVRDLNSKREEAGQRSIQVHDDKILKFAKKHFETLSWNGRQIRNAFQTAIALAEFDVRDDGEGERQAVMSKKQFKTIAHASIQFDSYLWHTHGGADQAAKAKREQVRWDYEVEGRPDRKPGLIDSSSESSSNSSSSSSDSSSDSSDSSSDAADSSDGGNEKRRRKKNKKKGKGKDKKSKKSESKNKKSRSKKDKHS